MTSPRHRAAGAIRVPRRSASLLGSPGPYGPNGAAYAASGPLWCRLESSLAYLSCFATPVAGAKRGRAEALQGRRGAGRALAARPILSLLGNFSLSMGAGRGSLGSPETIETTTTLSLPWEAWGREASVLGVTVAGSPFLGRGARTAGSN